MKPTRVAVGMVVGIALLVSGLLAAKPAAPAKPRQAVLPSWAPKHPSPEFLKAAKTLKPIPEEAHRYSPTYIPAWEMFGSLSDKQLREFLTPRQWSDPLASMPATLQKHLREREQAKQVGDNLVYSTQMVHFMAKTFTPRQRAIWDDFVKAWREEYRGQPNDDLLVLLYKWGAKKDLSNVQVSFFLSGKHAVSFNVAVRGITTGDWIAQI